MRQNMKILMVTACLKVRHRRTRKLHSKQCWTVALKKQFDQLNDLFSKFSRSTKDDLNEIKQSQDFLSSKFDALATSVSELRAENVDLRSYTSNLQLTKKVKFLEEKTDVSEGEIENLKQYIRRDMLDSTVFQSPQAKIRTKSY
jgi:hypothetical protein